MSLRDFTESRNLQAHRFEKQVWFTDEADMNNAQITAFRDKVCHTMDQIIAIANIVIRLDQKTEKTRGLQKKIQKAVQKFKTLNDSNSLLQIAMQDNIATVIGTSENTQKIDTYAEFFRKIKDRAKALQVASQR